MKIISNISGTFCYDDLGRVLKNIQEIEILPITGENYHNITARVTFVNVELDIEVTSCITNSKCQTNNGVNGQS